MRIAPPSVIKERPFAVLHGGPPACHCPYAGRMATAIVSGSGGLIGSESVKHLVEAGWDVIGLENDMRARFFGPEASTARVTERLEATYAEFRSLEVDIRDADGVERAFAERAGDIELVIHTAAQPSHDWAARDPQTDFGVNATGTLNLLEATRRARARRAVRLLLDQQGLRRHARTALPLDERETRLELPESITATIEGIDTSMSIDASTHSLFGVSKAAADLLVQEYGRYFGMPTVCFRGGCLTGPQHAGAQLHGFLAYLMRCTVTGDALHGLRLLRASRCATTSTAPTSSPASSSSSGRPGRRPSTTSAAGGSATARCSRRSRPASGSAGASSTGS